MVFREIPLSACLPPGDPRAAAPSPDACDGHSACSGYGTRANCPPLIILATHVAEDAAASHPPSTPRSQQA